jgi:hypothetical protein
MTALGEQSAHQSVSQPGLDDPLRLKDAVRIAFPFGGMTVSGLRREAVKGILVLERYANKDFVTLNAIIEMRKRCRDQQKVPVSGLNLKSEMGRESSSAGRHGSFETERTRSALVALEQTARALSKPSLNTSPRNTPSQGTADVIRLKS